MAPPAARPCSVHFRPLQPGRSHRGDDFGVLHEVPPDQAGSIILRHEEGDAGRSRALDRWSSRSSDERRRQSRRGRRIGAFLLMRARLGIATFRCGRTSAGGIGEGVYWPAYSHGRRLGREIPRTQKKRGKNLAPTMEPVTICITFESGSYGGAFPLLAGLPPSVACTATLISFSLPRICFPDPKP